MFISWLLVAGTRVVRVTVIIVAEPVYSEECFVRIKYCLDLALGCMR